MAVVEMGMRYQITPGIRISPPTYDRKEKIKAALSTGVLCVSGIRRPGNRSDVGICSNIVANAPKPEPALALSSSDPPPSSARIPSSQRLVYGLTRYPHQLNLTQTHPEVSVSKGPPPDPRTTISNAGDMVQKRNDAAGFLESDLRHRLAICHYACVLIKT